ncbi:hypothetical protein BCR35DRAFT_299000 [Leucosporidium creatinivorum]|uniref:Uncharacterized protein n=1 Tax=Leucosporidium creatinivorum TaxID=106004 RepID=A0A1Y2G2X2_9BASI|nr:hypothetical protein BCR35DRAFT_299000 [Leucosporidium creatinivorum]
MGLWSRTYVCCAVPLYNSGIYAILAQFTIVSLVTGILAFAAPSIVAVSIPSYGAYILGIVCILVALFQLFGFFGVYRERPSLFKTYARINTILVALALVIALVFIIISAARHGTAVTACEDLFASKNSTSTVTSGTQICSIWTWVQIGIMGLLFVIVGLCEAYFLMFTQIYSSEQKLDHARYNSVYSSAAQEIRESGLWDHPSATDPYAAPGYPREHQRQQSGLRNEVPREEYGDGAAVGGGGEKAGWERTEERFEPPVDRGDGYGYEGQQYGAPVQGYAEEPQHAYEYAQHQQHQAAPGGYYPEPQGYVPQQGGAQSWDPAYRR